MLSFQFGASAACESNVFYFKMAYSILTRFDLTPATLTRFSFITPAMRSLAVASRPKLSETEPKLVVFETYCYAFGGRIHNFAKVNVNIDNTFTVHHV